MRVEAFFNYARKRENLRLEKIKNPQKLRWTEDDILHKYRFCNVFREDDRNTIWLREHWRDPISHDPISQIFAAAVFRYINRIETTEAIRHLIPIENWNFDEFESILRDKLARNQPIVGAAYIIKTPNGMDKIQGIRAILESIFIDVEKLHAFFRKTKSLQKATEMLTQYPWVGPFMSYEIISDLRHTSNLNDAKDISLWANPGPGATRGIQRLMSEDGTRVKGLTGPTKLRIMRELLEFSLSTSYWPQEWGMWEMREVEHNLCEFDKYERARLGEGSPKQFYKPRKD